LIDMRKLPMLKWPEDRVRPVAIAVAIAALAALAGAVGGLAQAALERDPAPAERRGAKPFVVVGLTADQSLVAFPSDDPRSAEVIGEIEGLEGDEEIVGIDCRVADSKTYAVGDAGGVYRLSLEDAAATKVSQLTVPLEGERFDIDWNPAANLLRIVSDTGQNLRHNLDNSTATTLAVGATALDAPLTVPPESATATGVSGAAYYNNDTDPATGTALFALDTAADRVALQAPADAGLLTITGALSVDASGDAGLDVHYTRDGGGSGGIGLASLEVDGKRGLYEVDLLTGAARLVGRFPAELQVTDLTAGFRKDEIEGIY
jgi:Domain of unknown function (DUF4394)